MLVLFPFCFRLDLFDLSITTSCTHCTGFNARIVNTEFILIL